MRREAQVKHQFAHLYPTLTPGQWYTAAAVDGLIRGTRIVTEGDHVAFAGRILDEDHFEFRGGGPRRGSWIGLRTRHIDRHAVYASAD
jgi:hypothetical protein